MRLARPCGQRCPPFLPPCPGPPGSWSGCWGGPCVGGWAAETRISCPGASSGSDTQPLRECRRHPAGGGPGPRGTRPLLPLHIGALTCRPPLAALTATATGNDPTLRPLAHGPARTALPATCPAPALTSRGFSTLLWVSGGLRTPQNLVHRMRGVPGTALPRKRHDGSEPRPNVRVSGDSRLRVLPQGCLRGAHGLRPSPQQEAGLPPS